MATNTFHSSHKAKHTTAGSLASMNLGALPLGQLGGAVNWSNSTSFQTPEQNPWAFLSTETPEGTVSPKATGSEGVHAAPAETTVVSSAPEVANAETEIEQIAAPESETKGSDGVVAEIADAKAESDRVASEAAKEAEVIAAQSRTASEAADKQAAEIKRAEEEREAAEQASAAAQTQSEKIAADQQAQKETAAKAASDAKAAAEAKATLEKAEATEKALLEQMQIEQSQREQREQDQLRQEQLQQEMLQRGSIAIETARLESERQLANLRSKPIQPSVPLKVPAALASSQIMTAPSLQGQRSARTETSTDEYLAQLERLVLELNMELGRQRDDQQSVDPMQQLSHRIIALNLENWR